MILSFFSSRGWESWDVGHRPLIPEGMPVLVDDDLCFEDGPAAPRPTAVVNRWLCELPASGAPAPSSWENYARVVKEWMEFLAEHGVGQFDSRVRLKAALSRYAEPFTYRAARALFAGTGREMKVNLAVRRTPKPHVTIKYLEPDFTELFRKGLRGLAPDGSQDTGFHGRELTRNAAVGDHALATGMRLQEFTYLLPWEIPALPPEPTEVPIPFPMPAGITKGKKFRTTWTSYEALAGLHDGTRPYAHLREEFERRLQALQQAGDIPDPRQARITRLKAENAKLKERLATSEQAIGELTDFRTQALARLAAQHEEIVHLRQTAAAASRVVRLPAARSSTTVIGSCS
ncbi:hypothetical protein MOV08_35510 [Streptomyces yunnanensis]|uniref:Uncharacterized protein n=1 Tax=Streptomyces yunnanensis TaxID=156453 RepID=A0ABY8AGY7_9ACTN|nr:hypothetical protein [Streptomyces yunnanensis]WEB44073.1 hypothetical protein MOV08_35510 [Streptomyces yunnanensis]